MALKIKKTAKAAVEETKVAVQTATEVKKSNTGISVVKQQVEQMVSVPPTYANVGVTASRTINLGEYNNVKLGVSIHFPCAPTPDAIEETYQFCFNWVDSKMTALTEEHDGGHSEVS
jgi:hypothetical protein